MKNVEAPPLMGATTSPKSTIPAMWTERGLLQPEQTEVKKQENGCGDAVTNHTFQPAWFRIGSMEKKHR